ncbi:MAG: exodeoxyribonuclease VII small subunit [Bacteroidia bacterium]|nr:exodeoxyribonuclease VII small subunit [Bacteroidia bacterium]
MKKKQLTFEEAIQQLDELIQRLESGQISMDELKTTLSQSKELVDFCRGRLREIPPMVEELKNSLE